MEEIIRMANQLINECTYTPNEFELLPYSDIKNKEKFYTSYGSIVSSYNKLCNRIHKLNYCGLTLKVALSSLRDGDFTSRQFELYSRELRSCKDRIDECVSSLKPVKDSYEATLRFYSSLQYVINSYRMEEV